MSPVLIFKIISILSLVGGIFLIGVTYATLKSTGSLTSRKNVNNRNASGNSSEADELSLGDLADRIQSEIQEVDLSSLDTAQGKVEEGLQDVIRLTDGLENANLTSIIQLVRSNWHKLKPFLNGAEGLALASGIAQLVAALVLLKSPVQAHPGKSRHFSKIWIYHYFILGTVLLICSLVPWAFTSTQESNQVGSFLKKLSKLGPGGGNGAADAGGDGQKTELMRSLNLFYSAALFDALLLYTFGTVSYCTAK